jgi:protein-S-isoprenylcysteine O-methyltransferase Ste14
MSICLRRLLLWLALVFASLGGGLLIDLTLKTSPFPLLVRFVGLVGVILTHFLLKRTGQSLRVLGAPEGWGWTTRLMTTDVYRCVRHPHHLGIGFFMASLGLLIGLPWTFVIVTGIQWAWIFGFLFLVEERELVEKFGEEYQVYRKQVPMLLIDPVCILKVLSEPISAPEGESYLAAGGSGQ